MCRRSTIPVSSCSAPIGIVHGDALLRQLRAQALERAEEIGALPIEHVHEDDAREAAVLAALPVPRRLHLDSHDGAYDEERAFDDAQRRDRVTLEARISRRVDEVDLPALPFQVRNRGGERHLSPLLVVVPVAHRRPAFDGSPAGSWRPTGRGAPRRARSFPFRGDRRRRRCGSSPVLLACAGTTSLGDAVCAGDAIAAGWSSSRARRVSRSPRAGLSGAGSPSCGAGRRGTP